MGIRVLTKQLAGLEDLRVGNDVVAQTRNGVSYNVTAIGGATLPYDASGGMSIKAAIDAIGFQAVLTNVETLTADKTLNNISDTYQRLDNSTGGGPNPAGGFDVYLDSATTTEGKLFHITNTAGVYIRVYVGAVLIASIYAYTTLSFYYDGASWIEVTFIGKTSFPVVVGKYVEAGSSDAIVIGDHSQATAAYSTVIGGYANAAADGTAVGWFASADSESVAMGSSVTASSQSIAIGYGTRAATESVTIGWKANNILSTGEDYFVTIGARANTEGEYSTSVGYSATAGDTSVAFGAYSYAAFGALSSVAIGYYANADSSEGAMALGANSDSTKTNAIALGRYSKTTRASEIVNNINAAATQQFSRGSVGWAGITLSVTPTEIFLGKIANERFTVQANSIVTFEILVTGRDAVTDECAAFSFKGAVKRAGVNTTALLSSIVKDTLGKDAVGFDCAVTASIPNDALVLTVTSANSNSTSWAAQCNFVEVTE